ncbi:MAG TPA: hypothetical protein VE200_00575 [Xanthobacteraceae bacterium]|nr:hypothetical protein [Xanthobacteraceae bacterium]
MSELTDKLRTCAAHVLAQEIRGEHWAAMIVKTSAVDLLLEAANVLDGADGALKTPAEAAPRPPFNPEVDVPPLPDTLTSVGSFSAADLPTVGAVQTRPRAPKACPQCDSRAAKKVTRVGNRLLLHCPVCAKEWPYP